MEPARPETTPAVRHLLRRLAVVMQLPLVVACGVLLMLLWDHESAEADERMRDAAVAGTAALQERFGSIDLALARLAAEVPAGEAPQALADFHGKASRVARELGVGAIILVRPDGQQVVNTRVPFGTRLPRSPDAMLKAVHSGSPAANDLALAPIAKVHVAGFGVPVIHEGRVVYGLNAALESPHFRQVLQALDLPPGWNACIADAEHRVVAHRGSNRRDIGSRVPLIGAGAAAPGNHGPFRTVDGGEPSQVFYRVSQATGWSVHVTVPHDVLYAPIRGAATQLGLALAGVLGLSLWGATHVGRRISRSVEGLGEAARRFPAVDHVDLPRHSFQEAQDVATAFAASAKDLHVAREALRSVNEEFQRSLLTEMDAQVAAIARELHDDVGSSLAGMSLLVAAARAECEGRPQAAQLLESIQDQVLKSARKVRQLSRGIMPTGEEAGALVPALERLASETEAAAGIDCIFMARGDFESVPPAVSGHLYRIVQEALANAIRHGRATRVRVMLARAGAHCRLTVDDQGSGCDLADLPASQAGIGLRSIRARASAIGGTAELSGATGRGCRVRVSWVQAAAAAR